MNKYIFSKKVKIESNSKIIYELLKDEFKLYPNYSGNPDVYIKIGEGHEIPNIIQINPSNHMEFDEGFGMVFKSYILIYEFSNPLKITLNFKIKNSIKKMLEKILSKQFLTSVESVGQIVHENILVPLAFFFDDIVPIHGSSIILNGKLIIFGGTGGSGKSSILLHLIKDKNLDVIFYSDDMIMIGKNKHAYPNYAFPKIYAYNTFNNKLIEKKLLSGRGILDRLHWKIIKSIDPSKVRRRISPDEFWSVDNESRIPFAYIILNRGNYDKIKLNYIGPSQAAESTLKILQAEYWIIGNHILWHEINRILIGKAPFIKLDNILNRWYNLYINIFNDIKTMRIDIPYNISHGEFITKILRIIHEIIE